MKKSRFTESQIVAIACVRFWPTIEVLLQGRPALLGRRPSMISKVKFKKTFDGIHDIILLQVIEAESHILP